MIERPNKERRKMSNSNMVDKDDDDNDYRQIKIHLK